MASDADSWDHKTSFTGPRIVVGVDGSGASMRALAWAAAEAQLRNALLEVVHVAFARHEALDALAPGLLGAEETVLDRAVVQARALAPDVVVVGRLYDPPAGRALVSASVGADILVVGSRGLSGIKGIALGSVSSECAHHARCPVVVIRPPTADWADVAEGSRPADQVQSPAG